MKKLMLSFVVASLILFAASTKAQTPLDKVYDKYAGEDGFTAVNISKEMFQMFQSMGSDKSDADAKEMKKMMEQLNGLKVLTCDADSAKPGKSQAFYNEVSALYPAAVYKELMTVNDEGNNIRFLTKQDAAGKISEMVMLMKGKTESVVMSLTGLIDLATVSKLSKTLNIHGMENLKNVRTPKKK
jgi:hypothetical protein